MKFIHTFWSKPLNEHKSYNINLTSLLTVYAYSAECIRNLGETIELYADEYGAELLSFIPYNKVHIVKNIEDNNPYFFEALEDPNSPMYKICNLRHTILKNPLLHP